MGGTGRGGERERERDVTYRFNKIIIEAITEFTNPGGNLVKHDSLLSTVWKRSTQS